MTLEEVKNFQEARKSARMSHSRDSIESNSSNANMEYYLAINESEKFELHLESLMNEIAIFEKELVNEHKEEDLEESNEIGQVQRVPMQMLRQSASMKDIEVLFDEVKENAVKGDATHELVELLRKIVVVPSFEKKNKLYWKKIAEVLDKLSQNFQKDGLGKIKMILNF